MAQVITHPIFNYNKDVLKENDKSMWAHVIHRAGELPSKKFDTAFRYEIVEVSYGNITKMRGREFFEKLEKGHSSTRIFLVPSFYHGLYGDCLSPEPIVGYFFFKDQYFRVAKVYFLEVGTDIVISLENGVFDADVPDKLVYLSTVRQLFPPGTNWYLKQSFRIFIFSMESKIGEWGSEYHPPAEEACQDVREEIAKLNKIETFLNLAPQILSKNIKISEEFNEQDSKDRMELLHSVIVEAKKKIHHAKNILFRRIYPGLPPTLFAMLLGIIQTCMKLLSPVLNILFQINTIKNPTISC
ncbi:uncharacterized protein NDAI_0K03010 [Naumovozyma dairenensis CBS 421]|uniref:Uncharacterized protein n=1 Tax=Naumovozyma dairenensis (strain ATCC 10597 / BCRC 20456 / CBS 421 / NBRC 0211 / NRRL Y-12639) TaxID=1071378 RepID=G0WI81_NAUDC|nr:hypothetical protein NDAI_0K03010 [Naumovozyma dairenensis CBS 421]CCD27492.1 hypothetical protein NDAI_0K03010 [Naumovozyma dairenensis CBS 421]